MGDPAVETDPLPTAGQGSYGPKPGEVAKKKKQVKTSSLLAGGHIASELPNTKKLHLTFQIQHRHSRLPGLMRTPHDKPCLPLDQSIRFSFQKPVESVKSLFQVLGGNFRGEY